MSINWKEVCKFLSGAFFVSAGVNAYFYFTHLAVPFLGFAISPELLGLRSAMVTPPIIARTVRARPPTNVEATQSRDGERGSFAASPSSNRT
jgi:hypothetical protein